MSIMNVYETDVPGALVIEPQRYADARGTFEEVWHQAHYADAGIAEQFVQDNVSRSKQGVLRGLHYQVGAKAQGKLVTVLAGRVWDVAVDLRRDVPSFRQWSGVELSAESGRQLYVPEGCAHGFLALSEDAVVHYKCTTYWAPDAERTIRWDDASLDIAWPLDRIQKATSDGPILSSKDAAAPMLSELDSSDFL